MIRKFETQDLDAVMQIWLHGNLDAHVFIPASFWRGHFEIVRDMLPQAELYVHENEATRQIDGFIGLSESHIEGIFVCDRLQSQGIGKLLLDFVKESRTQLSLNVYQKNTRAIHFYQREGFEIQNEGLDEATGEKDYVMTWR